MAKATHEITKPRKRAAVTGAPVLVRLQSDRLSAIDAWRAKQPDLPTRPEAVRRLVDIALAKPSTDAN